MKMGALRYSRGLDLMIDRQSIESNDFLQSTGALGLSWHRS
jgi:hypothetical protein